jgi:hypothetical protein
MEKPDSVIQEVWLLTVTKVVEDGEGAFGTYGHTVETQVPFAFQSEQEANEWASSMGYHVGCRQLKRFTFFKDQAALLAAKKAAEDVAAKLALDARQKLTDAEYNALLAFFKKK